MLLKSASLLALLLLAGCPGDDDALPQCDVLDTSNVVIVTTDYSNAMHDVSDGSSVPLIGAPQGGHIMLVGARIRTATACQLTATAALRDPATQRVIGLEERPLLLEMRDDGWAVPRQGLDAMPNVAVCPSAASTTAVYGHTYKLELTLTRDGSPVVTTSAMVTPSCDGDAYCMQDCGGASP